MNELKTAIPALESAGRTKRFVSALPAITGLVTLAVESINGYLQSRRNKAREFLEFTNSSYFYLKFVPLHFYN